LLGAEQLAAMKPGSFIYNVGRGAVINTPDLIAALESGHLGGAGLDVVEPEPLPEDSPLWDMRNVLITSHTSGASPNYWERGAAILIENVRRFSAGETLTNVVDLEAGY
jgi:phosphoglycerate dehydrogenase-like enzyme